MALPGFFFGKKQTTAMETVNQACTPCPPIQNCVRKFEQKQHFLHRNRIADTDVAVSMVRKIMVCQGSTPVVDCQQ